MFLLLFLLACLLPISILLKKESTVKGMHLLLTETLYFLLEKEGSGSGSLWMCNHSTFQLAERIHMTNILPYSNKGDNIL